MEHPEPTAYIKSDLYVQDNGQLKWVAIVWTTEPSRMSVLEGEGSDAADCKLQIEKRVAEWVELPSTDLIKVERYDGVADLAPGVRAYQRDLGTTGRLDG